MKIFLKLTAALLLILGLLMPSLTVNVFAAKGTATQAQMLNYTSINIAVNQRVQIKANTDKKVKWSTSDKSVVKINTKGYITGGALGSAKIRAVVDGKKFYCKVNVVTPEFKDWSYGLEKGKTLKLSVGITTGVKWHSTNPYVATVSNNGTVKALKEGTAYIVATVAKEEYVCIICTVDGAVQWFEDLRYTTIADPNGGPEPILIEGELVLRNKLSGGYNIVDSYDYSIHDLKATVVPADCDNISWEIPTQKQYIMNYAALSNSELHEGYKNYIYQAGDKYGNFTLTEAKTTFVDVKDYSKYYTTRDYIVYFSRIRAKGKVKINCDIGYIDDGPESGTFYVDNPVEEIVNKNKIPITQDMDGIFINLILTPEQKKIILNNRYGTTVNCDIIVSECSTGYSQAAWDSGSKSGRLLLTVSDVKIRG